MANPHIAHSRQCSGRIIGVQRRLFKANVWAALIDTVSRSQFHLPPDDVRVLQQISVPQQKWFYLIVHD